MNHIGQRVRSATRPSVVPALVLLAALAAQASWAQAPTAIQDAVLGRAEPAHIGGIHGGVAAYPGDAERHRLRCAAIPRIRHQPHPWRAQCRRQAGGADVDVRVGRSGDRPGAGRR